MRQKVAPNGGYVNLADGLDNCDHSVGYAWTEVDVSDEMDALFGIGSDDGIKVWLNGKLIHENWTFRGARPDDDAVVLGGSTDTHYVHLAWRKDHPDLRSLPYPMLADTKRELTSALGLMGVEVPARM